MEQEGTKSTEEKPSATRRHREYDDIFEHVRSFGAYQRVIYVCTYVFLMSPMSGQFIGLVFALGTPSFHCATPNATMVTCPPQKCCYNCTQYAFAGPMRTTVSEWNLICDRAYLGATLQSCFFAGMLIGSLVTGVMSDALGRKKCIFINYTIVLIAGTASTFVDCITFFALLRFLVGFGLTGVMLTIYVFCVEMLGPKRRTLGAMLARVMYPATGLVLVLMAYLVRDWRNLLLVYTVPGFVSFVYFRWMPESPRWLVAHGHLDKAYDVITKFGPKKGKAAIDCDALKALLADIRAAQLEKEKAAKVYTPLDLLRTRKIRTWTLILAYEWFAVSCTYFGIYLFISQLAGNIFLNYTIMTFISGAWAPVEWFLLLKFGRRFVHAGLISFAGIVCLLTLAIYKDFPMITMGLTILGYLFLEGSFGSVYLITNELFPTVLRNTATGTGSMSARVGAIISPYIAMTGQFPGLSMALPVTIFGAVALAAGLLTYWLPETLFANLHQTTEETEAATHYYGLICWGKPLGGDSRSQAQETGLALLDRRLEPTKVEEETHAAMHA